jgi:hypothetical protein
MNYSFASGNPLPTVNNGHVFERLNFCRAVPHTPIFAGKTGLVFRGCNLVNCDVPADAVLEDCLHVHYEFCSNHHPEWAGKLTPCVANCPHVIGNDVIQVAGVTVATVYHYEDKVVV